ncbi:hypothetical protein ACFQX6_55130 [Streptosporangium lutulentum]
MMNRRRLVAAGLLLLHLGLTGCGVGGEPEVTPGATAKSAVTTPKAVSITVRSGRTRPTRFSRTSAPPC